MMRPRAAPSADRTAISRTRALDRASSRFAAFTHAISSSSPTADSSTSSMRCVRPTISRYSGTRNTRQPLSAGCSLASCASTALRSASACSGETPAFRRPIPSMKCEPRLFGFPSYGKGSHRSTVSPSASAW